MKKRGVFLTAAAAFAPVTGIFIISFAMLLHAYFPDLLILVFSYVMFAVNPDVSSGATAWIDHFIKFTGFGFIALAPALLCGGVLRLITPKAESVYLKFKRSLLVFSASAFAGLLSASVNEWLYIEAKSGDFSKYPYRSLFLGVTAFAALTGVAFFAILYIIKQKRVKNGEENRLPAKAVFLDLLRFILALPAFVMFLTAIWKLLLIFAVILIINSTNSTKNLDIATMLVI